MAAKETSEYERLCQEYNRAVRDVGKAKPIPQVDAKNIFCRCVEPDAMAKAFQDAYSEELIWKSEKSNATKSEGKNMPGMQAFLEKKLLAILDNHFGLQGMTLKKKEAATNTNNIQLPMRQSKAEVMNNVVCRKCFEQEDDAKLLLPICTFKYSYLDSSKSAMALRVVDMFFHDEDCTRTIDEAKLDFGHNGDYRAFMNSCGFHMSTEFPNEQILGSVCNTIISCVEHDTQPKRLKYLKDVEEHTKKIGKKKNTSAISAPTLETYLFGNPITNGKNKEYEFSDRSFVHLYDPSLFDKGIVDKENLEFCMARLALWLCARYNLMREMSPYLVKVAWTGTAGFFDWRYKDNKNPNFHLFLNNFVLMYGGRQSYHPKYEFQCIHQPCHFDGLLKAEYDKGLFPPGVCLTPLEDYRTVYFGRPRSEVGEEDPTAHIGELMFFPLSSAHGGITYPFEDPSNHCAFHASLDSTRNPRKYTENPLLQGEHGYYMPIALMESCLKPEYLKKRIKEREDELKEMQNLLKRKNTNSPKRAADNPATPPPIRRKVNETKTPDNNEVVDETKSCVCSFSCESQHCIPNKAKQDSTLVKFGSVPMEFIVEKLHQPSYMWDNGITNTMARLLVHHYHMVNNKEPPITLVPDFNCGFEFRGRAFQNNISNHRWPSISKDEVLTPIKEQVCAVVFSTTATDIPHAALLDLSTEKKIITIWDGLPIQMSPPCSFERCIVRVLELIQEIQTGETVTAGDKGCVVKPLNVRLSEEADEDGMFFLKEVVESGNSSDQGHSEFKQLPWKIQRATHIEQVKSCHSCVPIALVKLMQILEFDEELNDLKAKLKGTKCSNQEVRKTVAKMFQFLYTNYSGLLCAIQNFPMEDFDAIP